MVNGCMNFINDFCVPKWTWLYVAIYTCVLNGLARIKKNNINGCDDWRIILQLKMF